MNMTELEKLNIAKNKGYKYDPLTGYIIGIKGDILNSTSKDGYKLITMKYQGGTYPILQHRLGWFLYYNEEPPKIIDHIDRNPSNNKIENLRKISYQENTFNSFKGRGYSYDKSRDKFEAFIGLNNKKIHLGRFETSEEARNAYLEAKKIYHKINE